MFTLRSTRIISSSSSTLMVRKNNLVRIIFPRTLENDTSKSLSIFHGCTSAYSTDRYGTYIFLYTYFEMRCVILKTNNREQFQKYLAFARTQFVESMLNNNENKCNRVINSSLTLTHNLLSNYKISTVYMYTMYMYTCLIDERIWRS